MGSHEDRSAQKRLGGSQWRRRQGLVIDCKGKSQARVSALKYTDKSLQHGRTTTMLGTSYFREPTLFVFLPGMPFAGEVLFEVCWSRPEEKSNKGQHEKRLHATWLGRYRL